MFGYEPDMSWQEYVNSLEDFRNGIGLTEGWVPSTFVVAEVEGEIVGRSSIRHEITDYLAVANGHIGFCVLPAYRNRGYATQIFRLSLDLAKSVGIDRALITCDEENVASAKTIERCGGIFDGTVSDPSEGVTVRRYWINIPPTT